MTQRLITNVEELRQLPPDSVLRRNRKHGSTLFETRAPQQDGTEYIKEAGLVTQLETLDPEWDFPMQLLYSPADEPALERVLALLDRVDEQPGPEGERMVNTVVVRAVIANG
jgi:hypothetical protein